MGVGDEGDSGGASETRQPLATSVYCATELTYSEL